MPHPAGTEVRWTETADRDLEGIVDHIAGTSPNTADQVAEKLVGAADSLSALPERGRIVAELEHVGLSAYRELVLAPWRIVYRVHAGAAHVVAVLDGRRNVEDLLLQRMVRR